MSITLKRRCENQNKELTMPPTCPDKVAAHFPVAKDQIFTFKSPPPLNITLGKEKKEKEKGTRKKEKEKRQGKRKKKKEKRKKKKEKRKKKKEKRKKKKEKRKKKKEKRKKKKEKRKKKKEKKTRSEIRLYQRWQGKK